LWFDFSVEESIVPTVLIVDDSAVDRRLAGGLLAKPDWHLEYAAGGKEALEKMAAGLPDLVLTDLFMPEMNGLELVAAVKKTYPRVPIILMTSQGNEEIAAQALREGAASYVPKRRLADDLLPTVQRIMLRALDDRAGPNLTHYMEACDLVFILPNDLTLIHSLVNHLQRLLRSLPLSDETERLRVGIALEAALTNAYYHGNLEVGSAGAKGDRQAYDRIARERLRQSPYGERHIRVTAHISREEAVFTIRDQGQGFDIAKLPPTTLPDTDQGTGRGLILMRSSMDEVFFNDLCNEVTLIKRKAKLAPEDGEE
jgi:CheY-like chemotaxis protein